jgi:hypothetical protein
MPDCIACIESKLTVEPFNKLANRQTEPGELTHIDLWGKYKVMSILGHQYYIVIVDDAARYITIDFLKGKHEAMQIVRNYLMHLTTHGMSPRAIRTDRGTEFVNEKLIAWCQENGIETQLTAPYSTAQNGVVERMNRTLVELAWAMINAQKLPEFLWELAVAHAAYVWNCSYTKAIEDKTPYEIWHNEKPDISHLHEFGTSMWILQQGLKEPRKMLPKSVRRVYVGHEDGPRAVKYYVAETRKILTSHNYRLLSLQNHPAGAIVVVPDRHCEGELRESAWPMGTVSKDGPLGESPRDMNRSGSSKRKQDNEGNLDEPCKTHGIKRDYQHLNDPFSDKKNEDHVNEVRLAVETYTSTVIENQFSDEPKTLEEARHSPEWIHWEQAIQAELGQIYKRGTWSLVDKPKDTVPISNKWVFTHKYNKDGSLNKHKCNVCTARNPTWVTVVTRWLLAIWAGNGILCLGVTR